MDDNVLESRHAATQLSLADLRDLQAVPFTSSEDEQLAHTLWREELEHFASTLADRQLVQDSQTALRIGQTLDTVRTQREQRSARLALAAHPYRRNSPNSATSASTVPSASTSGDVGLNLKTSRETSACVSCTEEVGAVAARANCGPLFSAPCLIRLFRLATRGECLFPPSCCTMPIPDALALPLLDDGDAKDYRQASEEFCSPKRLYCSNGKCGRWLGPLTALKRDVVCCKCGRLTCSACKAPAHDAQVACADDDDGDAALKLAAEVNGVRCPKCRRVVERNGGCPHVADLRIPTPG